MKKKGPTDDKNSARRKVYTSGSAAEAEKMADAERWADFNWMQAETHARMGDAPSPGRLGAAIEMVRHLSTRLEPKNKKNKVTIKQIGPEELRDFKRKMGDKTWIP